MSVALRSAIVVAWLFCTLPLLADDGAGEVGVFLENHCVACHGETDPEGDLSLAGVDSLDADNAPLWQRVLTQVATGEMPPDGEPRPELRDREAVISWIVDSMGKANVKPQLPGGPLPQDGNLIDHDRLFSGRFQGPASSPPRFWRRSQSQYDALMEKLWVIPKLRYENAHSRNSPEHAAYSYSRPFPQMAPTHLTNYAGGVHADEAVLRALMSAGSQMAIRLTTDKPPYNHDKIQPLERMRISIRRLPEDSPLRAFILEPPLRPPEFAPFLGADAEPTAEQQREAVRRVFRIVLDREPTADDLDRYGGLLAKMIDERGALTGLRGLITAVFVSPEYVFRMELGRGPADEHGRRMLSPNELVYSIAYALTDDGPDAALWEAVRSGKLTTRADVEREVRRILADDSIEKHRVLRFFQEFFGYTRAADVFKDKDGWHEWVHFLVRDADLLVEQILAKDREVFAELLTTDRYFVAFPSFEAPAMLDAIIARDLENLKEGMARAKSKGDDPRELGGGPYRYQRLWSFAHGLTPIPKSYHRHADENYVVVYGYDYRTFDWTRDQPIKTPGRRAGILTHPAWLVAHSTNFDNDIVGRGHWIRENLLAGKIPDVPLDVEAQVPDEPGSTLRHRMRVTRGAKCIRCHRRMDPLGFPFEIYDHYGQFREVELTGEKRKDFHVQHRLRDHWGKPIDPSGEIIASGEAELNSPVEDAIDLVHKLADSPRVRQSIIRHAFRYWMGRNEVLSDSPTLIAADEAYVKSDGSFNEVLVSLLTSDSFLYRK